MDAIKSLVLSGFPWYILQCRGRHMAPPAGDHKGRPYNIGFTAENTAVPKGLNVSVVHFPLVIDTSFVMKSPEQT